MIKRVISVSSGPTRLSLAHRQLVIERDEQPKATVPCEDIGVLIVDHPRVSYTHSVFTELLECGAAVVLCGADHHPSGLLLPLAGNKVQTERHREQIEASLPLKKRLWQALVAAKLRQQAAVLIACTGADAGLAAMAERVRSGDPDNLEAQGAQRYWPRLFGAEFQRAREGPPPNNMLNYGYMVLRAAMARAIVSAGLLPTLGLHHRNRYNPFCLADDLMEPWRPFVDFRVAAVVDAAEGPVPTELSKEHKQALLSILNERVMVNGQRTPVLLGLHTAASSVQAMFAGKAEALAMPDGLFVADDGADASAA